MTYENDVEARFRAEIAALLRASREVRGWSRAEAAAWAGSISANEIQAYEDAREKVPADHLYRLLAIYEAPLFALYEIERRIRQTRR